MSTTTPVRWRPTDVGSVRRGAMYAVIVVLTGSLTLTLARVLTLPLGESLSAAGNRGPLAAVAGVPVLSLLAWQQRGWRALLFGVAAALVAASVPVADPLWPAVACLVAIGTYEDAGRRPWVAGLAGLVGAVASTVLHRGDATLAPYAAVGLGVAVGLLLRALRRLDRETEVLRERTLASEAQARWLEQRTALARELHDIVGHHVTAMVVQSEAGAVGDPTEALTSIGGLGRQALVELDALVVHLRDPDAPLTVTASPRLSDIDELLAAPLRHQGVEVSVRVDPEPGLDAEGVLTAYRIAQEALTNVTRHAHARSAWVELERTGPHVRLRVSDDGVGPPARVERGAGLVGIEERVRSARGEWDLSERPGGGTIVDVRLPVRSG